MFRLPLIALALSASISAPVIAEEKKPLTAGEAQTIRALAGTMVGGAMAKQGLDHLAIIANRSPICSTLTGGLVGGFTAGRDQAQVTLETLNTDADIAIAVERATQAKAIYLAFGGNWTKPENVAMLEKTLEALAAKNYDGALVFHVTTWAQKQPQDIVAKNEKVAAYLKTAKIRTGTLNLAAKEATVNKVTFDGTEFKLEPALKVPMRDDLVALFKRI